ncbi:GNAT family N-acetyltransferase [Arthrobacter sp. PM3]|uniref:GNAT family N-acetyltransferase n=1 Tax=Arthrobacter sp. PM3 TaxID=2017685 RepID=UPI000E1021AC|nr:GNAT family N-acetyltransferase [Arthrobacter sp. PM3]AXJ10995.1 GNAT family N-acetyltransferase [Arthrobacter sp. PM3]
MSAITVANNPERSRFEVLDADADAGSVIGQAAYVDDARSGQRIFYHTVINEEYGGRGLAKVLAEQALDATVAEGLVIVPVCPFIKKYLRKHTGYADHVAAVTSAHLDFVRDSLAQRVHQ